MSFPSSCQCCCSPPAPACCSAPRSSTGCRQCCSLQLTQRQPSSLVRTAQAAVLVGEDSAVDAVPLHEGPAPYGIEPAQLVHCHCALPEEREVRARAPSTTLPVDEEKHQTLRQCRLKGSGEPRRALRRGGERSGRDSEELHTCSASTCWSGGGEEVNLLAKQEEREVRARAQPTVLPVDEEKHQIQRQCWLKGSGEERRGGETSGRDSEEGARGWGGEGSPHPAPAPWCPCASNSAVYAAACRPRARANGIEPAQQY
eukprot:120410-Rhodomonas_salina.2